MFQSLVTALFLIGQLCTCVLTGAISENQITATPAAALRGVRVQEGDTVVISYKDGTTVATGYVSQTSVAGIEVGDGAAWEITLCPSTEGTRNVSYSSHGCYTARLAYITPYNPTGFWVEPMSGFYINIRGVPPTRIIVV